MLYKSIHTTIHIKHWHKHIHAKNNMQLLDIATAKTAISNGQTVWMAFDAVGTGNRCGKRITAINDGKIYTFTGVFEIGFPVLFYQQIDKYTWSCDKAQIPEGNLNIY